MLVCLGVWTGGLAPAPARADEPEAEPVELGGAVVGSDLGDDSIFLDPSMTGEAIYVWGERPDKPFDRDTELRLTGAELAERGATDLAQALELLPDLYVREAGRGGRQIDIRGARKGSVKILIDGIAVSDPYYGNLDLSSIPITDIVQIRVSTSPASPIDGPGGPGGVVEVHTRDAVGDRLVRAQVRGSTLPSAEAAATGRTMLTDTLAMRVSGSGTLGSRDFSVAMPQGRVELDENRRQSVGAARLEYRRGKRRVVTDLWMQHGNYVVPPVEDEPGDLLVIDGEAQGRVGISADDQVRGWRLQGSAHYHILSRRSTYYEDAELMHALRREDLDARRAGASFLANRPIGSELHVIGSVHVDTESADVMDFSGNRLGGRATVTQIAAGAQYERGLLDVDAAAGLAVPLGLGAAPWPEAKLSVAVKPARVITLKATGGHKGRVPTLRERFRLDIGNRSLGPEKVLFAELATTLKPLEVLELEMASFQRRTNGLIRFDGERAMLINTGTTDIRGVDVRATLRPRDGLELAGHYSFIDADSETAGTDPFDFFPNDRASAQARVDTGRLGATARVGYVGEQIDRRETLPGRTTLDLSAFARFGEGFFASLRLDNALDHRYQLRSGVYGPGRVLWMTLQRDWQ